MPRIGVSISHEGSKRFFFDRPAVERLMDRRTRMYLSRFGAFVRRRAQTSMRRRKAASAPGQPPSVHDGGLRRSILFAAEPFRQSVVIGPTDTAKTSGSKWGTAHVQTDAPEMLEHGGETTRHGWVGFPHPDGKRISWAVPGQGWAHDLRSRNPIWRNHPAGPAYRAKYAARPFMRPALEYVIKNEQKRIWQESIRRAA